jgi:hypothetical protein
MRSEATITNGYGRLFLHLQKYAMTNPNVPYRQNIRRIHANTNNTSCPDNPDICENSCNQQIGMPMRE